MEVITSTSSVAASEFISQTIELSLELAFEAKKVFVEKESFAELASYVDRIVPLLKELNKKDTSDAENSFVEILNQQVKIAKQLTTECSQKNRVYLLINCRLIAKRIKEITREISRALSLIPFSQLGVSESMKRDLGQLCDVMQSVEFKTAVADEMILEKIESGIQERNVDRTYANNLLVSIAQALGISTERSSLKKEFEDFKSEIENAQLRKDQAEAIQMDQIIALLERADATCSPEEKERKYLNKRTSLGSQPLEPLQSFYCPITREVMLDPVETASGHTFERAAIEKWLADGSNFCPLTMIPLDKSSLRPNKTLKQSIEEWKDRNTMITIASMKPKLSKPENEEEVVFCLDELQKLCEERGVHREWIVLENYIPTLVELLGGKSREIRTRTLVLLCILAKDSDDAKDRIAKVNGVIESIVRSLGRRISEGKLAVELLLELSQNETLKKCIGMVQGCILLLVTMSNSDDTQAATRAHELLAQLSFSDQNVIQMAKANYFTHLLHRLSSGSEEVKMCMVTTLAEMELTDHNKSTLFENGALDSLLHLVSQGAPRMKETAAKALRNLSSLPKNSIQIIRNGSVNSLVSLLYNHTSSHCLQDELAAIIMHLAMSTMSQNYNGPPVSLFESDGDIDSLFSFIVYTRPLVQECLLRSFYAMCHSPLAVTVKTKLRQNPGNIKSCENENQKVRANAVKLFCCLTEDGDDKEIIDRMGLQSIETLIKIIKSPLDEEEISSAMGVLSNLTQSSQLTESLLKAEGLPVISSCLRDGMKNRPHKKQLIENTVGSLCHFTIPTNQSSQKKVAETGVIPLLVQLLELGTSLTKRKASISLGQLSKNSFELTHPIPRSLGGIFKCFSTQSESACPVHQGICTVEMSFCLVEADAVSPLVRLLGDSDLNVCEASLDALLTLIEAERLQYGSKVLAEANSELKSIYDPTLCLQLVGYMKKNEWSIVPVRLPDNLCDEINVWERIKIKMFKMILFTSPEAIQRWDKYGYELTQLAIINPAEDTQNSENKTSENGTKENDVGYNDAFNDDVNGDPVDVDEDGETVLSLGEKADQEQAIWELLDIAKAGSMFPRMVFGYLPLAIPARRLDMVRPTVEQPVLELPVLNLLSRRKVEYVCLLVHNNCKLTWSPLVSAETNTRVVMISSMLNSETKEMIAAMKKIMNTFDNYMNAQRTRSQISYVFVEEGANSVEAKMGIETTEPGTEEDDVSYYDAFSVDKGYDVYQDDDYELSFGERDDQEQSICRCLQEDETEWNVDKDFDAKLNDVKREEVEEEVKLSFGEKDDQEQTICCQLDDEMESNVDRDRYDVDNMSLWCCFNHRILFLRVSATSNVEWVSPTSNVEQKKKLYEVTVKESVVQDQSPPVNEDTRNLVNKIELKKKLYEVTVKGDRSELKSVLKKDEGLLTEAISGDGSTVLHLAVGIGHNHLVKKLLSYINDLQVLEKRYSDGSTPLHVAATVGNKHAVELLLKKNCQLLHIEDHNAKVPLQKAYENMQLDTIGYLLKAVNDAAKTELQSPLRGPVHPDDDIAVLHLLVNAIVAKQYSLALVLVRNFPKFSSYSDEVLYSIAKSFPDGESFILFSSIKKKREQSEAKEVLEIVCDEIDKLEYSGTYHPYYTRPILEASCQNAVEVVHEILKRSPEAIQSTDKNGYGIIQLAIIHRSEKVFRYIYEIGEHKNLYRTLEDSSKNNILHLAGKLAPVSVRDQRTRCPALQLQQDLQWQEEIKKCVCPTYMIFNKEHKNLVKEGERWTRTMAKSGSIIAVLSTTLAFSAAIAIPGVSDQVKGTPFLLVFWSIQASCYHVKDFLVSLPRKVFTGLFFLLVSTTAMMVAFSAVLFLVFCHQIPWMLAPIAVLAIIPTAFVVTLQFPLMVEFFKSTYLGIFGNHRKQIRRRYFNKEHKNSVKEGERWMRTMAKSCTTIATVQPIPWDMKLKHAFLHTSAKQVIYRDFKASNILLDGSYNAKISDFGLAKVGPSATQSHVTTRVMGTYGYAAQEYVSTDRTTLVLGEAGFGPVYKGWLEDKSSSKSNVIAVKKLISENMQGLQEWQAEVNFIGRLSQPNLVKLLGYCYQGNELLLVYEFMQKGSLENHLFGRGSTVQPIPLHTLHLNMFPQVI